METPAIDYDMNFEEAQQSDADKKLVAIFFQTTVKNEAKTIAQGRPMFDVIDQIKIIIPGSRDTVVADADETYQRRFPLQWARYKQNKDQTEAAGTPLSVLPGLTIAQVAEFKALQIHTVENLAGLPDALAHKFMGFQGMRQKAIDFLEAAKGQAPVAQLHAELEKKDEQIAQLMEANAAMMARIEAIEKQQQAKAPAKA